MTGLGLAFVDVETTGLDPLADRVAEIGVVTVDGALSTEWTSFVAQRRGAPARPPRSAGGQDASSAGAAPSFKDIAVDLDRRLAGRLFIAHNARFDYAFLKAEFRRVGVEFDRQTLCTVMLSRKLFPHHPDHGLDALMQRHRLGESVRHRALPDARLLWRFWQTVHRERGQEALARVVAELLAGPVLPEDLSPALIERLPEAPGVYTLRDADGAALRIGEARNLRLHLIAYFRMDRASAKAIATAHRVKSVTWRVTQGMLGARLLRIALTKAAPPGGRRKEARAFSWRLAPDGYPAIELISVKECTAWGTDELFGRYLTERKARNALGQLATRHYLCHALLGLGDAAHSPCLACPRTQGLRPCADKYERLKHLVKLHAALQSHRVAAWPYPGPVGIRERTDLHVIDQWRYLGTATTDTEVHEALDARPGEVDLELFDLLAAKLSKLPRRRLVDLSALANAKRSDAPSTGTGRACHPDP